MVLRCVLALAISPLFVRADLDSPSCVVEKNTDYQTSNLQYAYTGYPTVVSCADWCSSVVECKFWTHVGPSAMKDGETRPDGTPSEEACYLKTQKGASRAATEEEKKTKTITSGNDMCGSMKVVGEEFNPKRYGPSCARQNLRFAPYADKKRALQDDNGKPASDPNEPSMQWMWPEAKWTDCQKACEGRGCTHWQFMPNSCLIRREEKDKGWPAQSVFSTSAATEAECKNICETKDMECNAGYELRGSQCFMWRMEDAQPIQEMNWLQGQWGGAMYGGCDQNKYSLSQQQSCNPQMMKKDTTTTTSDGKTTDSTDDDDDDMDDVDPNTLWIDSTVMQTPMGDPVTNANADQKMCYKLGFDRLTAPQAQKQCEMEGGNLVEIRTKEQNDAVLALFCPPELKGECTVRRGEILDGVYFIGLYTDLPGGEIMAWEWGLPMKTGKAPKAKSSDTSADSVDALTMQLWGGQKGNPPLMYSEWPSTQPDNTSRNQSCAYFYPRDYPLGTPNGGWGDEDCESHCMVPPSPMLAKGGKDVEEAGGGAECQSVGDPNKMGKVMPVRRRYICQATIASRKKAVGGGGGGGSSAQGVKPKGVQTETDSAGNPIATTTAAPMTDEDGKVIEPTTVAPGKGEKDKEEPMTDKDGKVITTTTAAPMTDKDGKVITTTTAEPMTDKNGKVVTTTAAPMTDKDGKVITTTTAAPMTDKDGKVITTTTAAPMTDKDGKVITTTTAAPTTDKDGKVITTTTAAPMTDKDGKVITTTTAAPMTDKDGNVITTTTAAPMTDKDGKVITTTTAAPMTDKDGKVITTVAPKTDKNGNVVTTTTKAPSGTTSGSSGMGGDKDANPDAAIAPGWNDQDDVMDKSQPAMGMTMPAWDSTTDPVKVNLPVSSSPVTTNLLMNLPKETSEEAAQKWLASRLNLPPEAVTNVKLGPKGGMDADGVVGAASVDKSKDKDGNAMGGEDSSDTPSVGQGQQQAKSVMLTADIDQEAVKSSYGTVDRFTEAWEEEVTSKLPSLVTAIQQSQQVRSKAGVNVDLDDSDGTRGITVDESEAEEGGDLTWLWILLGVCGLLMILIGAFVAFIMMRRNNAKKTAAADQQTQRNVTTPQALAQNS